MLPGSLYQFETFQTDITPHKNLVPFYDRRSCACHCLIDKLIL
ncbi:hypothetical protein FDUTEX481_08192 [Tolypothrix sp. PCC 7601]|nr:hypothetical protein FDUTEX481_08192 [Tolypothrix sp. PCC 7601]